MLKVIETQVPSPIGNFDVPHDIENEQCVLGCMLMSQSATDYVFRTLTADDFFREAHKIIFLAICTLMDRDIPVDIATMFTELQRRKALDAVGGRSYITALFDTVGHAENVVHYAEAVRVAAIRRDIQAAGVRLLEISHTDYDKIETVMDEAERAVLSARREKVSAISGRLGDVGERIYESALTNSKIKGALLGLPTGFRDLDFYTKGLQAPRVYYLAARPRIGKTSLAVRIGLNIAMRNQEPVLYVSLETDSDELGVRAYASEANINGDKILLGDMAQEEWDKFAETRRRMQDVPFEIDDESTTLPKIRSRIRKMLRDYGSIGLLVVDYIQFMEAPKAERRDLEIGLLTRGLKDIAKEFKIPVLALSQLSREADGQKPTLRSLRESGSIENDANFVMALHREPYQGLEIDRPDLEDTDAFILKNRNGPSGSFKLRFHGDTATYRDIAFNREAPTVRTKAMELHLINDPNPTGY